MAGANYLLDTVIVSAYFKREPVIREKLRDTRVYISSITVGELIFGAYNSNRVEHHLNELSRFFALNVVVGCGLGVADRYGQLKRALRLKGRPIPENDIWIAATAVHHGLIMATRDAHFNEIDDLMMEWW